MIYQYRLEEVDKTVTNQLKREKEEQRDKQDKARRTDLPQVPQELPAQPQRSLS